MLRFLFILLLVGLSVQPAAATTETRDDKHYGNCVVYTSVDLMTDEEKPILACSDSTDLYCQIQIRHTPKGLKIALRAGLELSYPCKIADPIPVTIRVYPSGPVIRREALGCAMSDISDHELAESLLDQLAAGQKLVFEVGTDSGVIDLTGSARAVQDFRQRHLLLNRHPQTLEVPRNQQ